MRKPRPEVLVLLLLLVVPLAGCAKPDASTDAAGDTGGAAAAAAATDDGAEDAADAADIRALADGAYFGLVRSQVLPPEGSGTRSLRRSGKASAELQPSGRFMVVGSLEEDADAGFAAEGDFAGGGWSGGSDGVELRIAPGGAISGGGLAGGNRMTIEGTLTRRKLDLYFELELQAPSAGGFPAGTRFRFGYELWRPYEGGAQAAGDDDCREVVYRTKLVPNLSGGAMGMVQVPECRY
ncbi:hypothetical protein [Luteimonas arsenica]|uniref:hypothetical protein n=1 Tax=Luteimonas arsenica TaxID=1586242 RepID=UPI0010553042|nr:hypothetical protein [Luteimonas arsenica]